jgi:hypothetical protein
MNENTEHYVICSLYRLTIRAGLITFYIMDQNINTLSIKAKYIKYNLNVVKL